MYQKAGVMALAVGSMLMFLPVILKCVSGFDQHKVARPGGQRKVL